ncbi:MAG: hypothetical protein ACJAVR_000039 [Paracoccaceae bacterium]|jgi:hypothetical protein
MRFIFAILVAATLSACASGARPVAMISGTTPGMADIRDEFVVASVTGGEETSPMWVSKVSSDDFKQALIASLQRAGAYDPSSGLKISAELISLEQPLLGISMTVTPTVDYTIVDAAGATVLSERVVSPFTAQFSDSFLAVERLRLANEGAIRENIRQFLALLSLGDFSVPTS